VKLKIAENLSLPVEVVTQAIAIIAKRRAGKSYLMRRLVEQLHLAGQQVVLVDPKGDQWGIRSAADGKAPGLPFVILGGERGDAPLEASGGEVVAQLVVKERVSAVLDLSLFRKHEVATFMTAFLESLYRLKAQETYRTPVMLVIDEADAIAPQKPQAGEERMLGAAEDIVRRGGQRGLGCVLVTQRSAVLAKNVLTQAEVLIALRTIAPQDLAAMNAWIDVHGTVEQKKTLMESLPALPTGDAWVWSPGWPTADGIFKHVHVLPIETFDSGATPKPGEKRREPKTVADVDLEALKRQMAETIERKKADDPRELRKTIADLRKEVTLLQKTPPAAVTARTVEKPVLKDSQIAALDAAIARMEKAIDRAAHVLTKPFAGVREQLGALAAAVKSVRQPALPMPVMPAAVAEFGRRFEAGAHVERRPTAPRAQPHASGNGHGTLPPGELATLTAALQYPGLDRKRLTVLTGYKRSSRDAYIVRLASKGLIEVASNALHATEAGAAALPSFEPLPTGAALVSYWQGRLPEGERRTLDVLIHAGGAEVAREVIDETTGYKRSSRDAYLVRLKARGLVEFSGRGTVRASEELFS
jgi:hypothetical protein